jgi:hypothetical protein
LLFLTSSDLIDSLDIKMYSGYGLLGLIGLSVTVNLGVLIIRTMVSTWNTLANKLKEKCFKKSSFSKTVAIKPQEVQGE